MIKKGKTQSVYSPCSFWVKSATLVFGYHQRQRVTTSNDTNVNPPFSLLGTGLLVSENHDGGLEVRRARATHTLTFYIYNVCINYFLSIFFFTLIFFLKFRGVPACYGVLGFSSCHHTQISVDRTINRRNFLFKWQISVVSFMEKCRKETHVLTA